MRTKQSQLIKAASESANLRFDTATGRWQYDVRLRRLDGSVFRRAGSAATEEDARVKRDYAFHEYNSDAGRSRDEKRQQKRDHTDTLVSWTEYVFGTLLPGVKAPTTLDAYYYSLGKHCLPHLGKRGLEEIGTAELQKLIDDLNAQGQSNAARQLRSATVTLFEYAVLREKLDRNPAKALVVKSAKHAEEDDDEEHIRRFLSQEEIATLLTTAEGTDMFLPILLGARFGLRIGECIGLKWANVDLARNSLRVTHQRQWTRAGMVQIKTKSKLTRTLPIPPSVRPILAKAKAQAEATGQEFVCLWEGQPFAHKKASQYMREIVAKAGLDDPQPTHHSLRGSFLTHCANVLGARPHDLMRLAGHADINTTMRYYISSTDEGLQNLVSGF